MTDSIQPWSFDQVADHFDDHIRNHLPWYDMVTRLTAFMASAHVIKGTNIVDIGASTGNISRALLERIGNLEADYGMINIEPNDAMRDNFSGAGVVYRSIDDAEIPDGSTSVVICFLSLSFIDRDELDRLNDQIVRILTRDGVVILVDKFEAPFYLSEFRANAFNEKILAGVSSEEIIRKEISLVGTQHPVTVPEADIGGEVFEFFRMGEFAGYVVRKYGS